MENISKVSLWKLAEIELTYKSNYKASLRPKISGSHDAYQILVSSWEDTKIEFVEQFKILLLNRANRVLGYMNISSGSSTGTIADPKLIFAAAIKANACGIILSHNHPSGNLVPSQADIDLTRKIREGGKILEIQILDHVILTSEGYYSFVDEGIL